MAGRRARSRPPRPSVAPPLAVDVDVRGFTHGGEGVATLPDGRACFVPYTIPGERVRVEVVETHRRWARARLLDVLQPSPDRVTPPCPFYGPGACGGCRLQHIGAGRQAELKRQVVRDQLERIGKFAEPPVSPTVQPAAFRYRNSARFAVAPDGRLGYRRAGSHEVEPVDECLLLEPAAQAVRDAAGDTWSGVEEVVVRAGVAGTAAIVLHTGESTPPALPAGHVPVALAAPAAPAEPLRGDATVIEDVAGRRFRVSPTSFFQASRTAAAAMVDLVRRGAAVRPGDVAVDLYAGVGLFAAALAEAGAIVTAVEGSGAACEDARHNLPDTVEVVHADVDAYVAALGAPDVVVLDPPRDGAGVDVMQAIAAASPRTVVYVSCDPAALARDARALAERGYELTAATPVDQFAQTASIETVAVFQRT